MDSFQLFRDKFDKNDLLKRLCIELDNVFQIWTAVVYFLCHDSCFGQIWSFSIDLLRKVDSKFVPSQKRFKDRESEFSKSLDHLSCCWLNVVPVQTDSHMVQRVWYNMKIHPFSGNFLSKSFKIIFSSLFS